MKILIASIPLCMIFCLSVTKAQEDESNVSASRRPTNEETLESLRKEVSALAGKTDKDSERKLLNLKPFLATAELDLNDCSETTFTRFKVWIEDRSVQTETNKEDIVNLLSYKRRELWKNCEPILLDRLTEAVKKLTPKQKKMATKIAEEIVKANRGNFDFSYPAAATGIANYLKHDNLLYRTKSARIFSMAWRRHMIETCEAFNDDINTVTYIYRTMDQVTQAKLGRFEKDWLLVSRVCMRTADLHDEVSKEILKIETI